MRIAYVSAGAAGMYCGSCIHDNTLAASLQELGDEVALLPTYTPLRTDEPNVSDEHLFFGALNVYLSHRFRWFRRSPSWLRRSLDRPGLIQAVAGVGVSTDPAELGALTLSVLRGEEGPHREELERLVTWLRDDFEPDVVHLTNSLFLGLASRLRETLQVPVVVGVQGEDHFVAGLGEPARTAVLREMRRRASHASVFVAPSRAYARTMAELLAVDHDRVRAVPYGILLDGHAPPRPRRSEHEVVIGFLARICPDKGLHLLARAFCRLARRLAGTGLRLRLRAAGYLPPQERPYLERVRRILDEQGLGDRFEYAGELDRPEKLRFLASLDVFSVPALAPEAKGLSALEAMASGVPAVLPRAGSLPELVEATGGGVLVGSGSVDALAEGLQHLIESPHERLSLGRRGREAVFRLYSSRRMAEDMAMLFRELVHGGSGIRAAAFPPAPAANGISGTEAAPDELSWASPDLRG